MTAIVGIDLTDIGPVLAADSLCVAGYMRRPQRRKIVPLSWDSALAVSGAGRSLHLVEQASKELAEVKADPPALVSKLRQILHDDGYKRDENESVWTHMDSAFMLANSDGLWVIDASMVSARVAQNSPFGIGCGGEFAMGAMHVSLSMLMNMPEVPSRKAEYLRIAMRTSLEAAERFSIGCGGDFEMWMPKASSSYGEFTTLRKGY